MVEDLDQKRFRCSSKPQVTIPGAPENPHRLSPILKEFFQ